MKLLSLLFAVVALALSARAAELPVVSPEVQPGRAILRLKAPGASEVAVRGNFAEGKVTLTKGEGGVWK